MTKELYISIFIILFVTSAGAQSFRIEDIKNTFGKGKPLKLSGNFSANGTYSAGEPGRDPFAYYLNGSVSLNIYGLIDLPFSFNFTNSGNSYRMPSMPNRLSLQPSYKWIKAYIGDVSMNFSPYTLNGHQFTGAGVELTPGDWEFAVMYGRLLRAVEYNDSLPDVAPTYKRMGYGVKAGVNKETYMVSVSLLKAKDERSSLSSMPDSLGVAPMDNISGSVSFSVKPVSFIEVSGEYGFSSVTADITVSDDTKTLYHAFKGNIDYVGESNRFGIGYERIDPNYQTFGAYYFTNDLENVTLNGNQSLWDGKVNLTLSLGYEHDDLKGEKARGSSRAVGSAGLEFTPNECLSARLSYSNFQSYSNARSNFESINQENPLDLLDTLRFTQLSRSANLNLSWQVKKTEEQTQSLSLNVAYQDAANKQGEVYQPGSVTEMINGMAGYSFSLLKTGLIITAAVNLNNSRLLNANTLTLGPTLSASKRLLKNKLSLNGSISYNTANKGGAKQSEVFLCRLNGGYSLGEHHSLTLAYNYQWRSTVGPPARNTSLLTAGYAWHF
jgi:hypothetical protein